MVEIKYFQDWIQRWVIDTKFFTSLSYPYFFFPFKFTLSFSSAKEYGCPQKCMLPPCHKQTKRQLESSRDNATSPLGSRANLG